MRTKYDEYKGEIIYRTIRFYDLRPDNSDDQKRESKIRYDAWMAAIDAVVDRLKEVERQLEMHEWMAYQRRIRPGITDEEIMSLTYVPEWRDHDRRHEQAPRPE